MPVPAEYLAADEIAQRVLVRLAVVGTGQSPSPDDIDVARNAFADVHAELTHKGQLDEPYDATPRYMVDGLVRIVSARVGPSFGKFDDATASALEDEAMRVFFRTNAEPAAADAVKVDYF